MIYLMACRLFGAKPSSGLFDKKHISEKIDLTYKIPIQEKYIWKCRVQNDSHFSSSAPY